jgi:hypothetical protein
MPNVFRAALFRASRLALQANAKAMARLRDPSAIREKHGIPASNYYDFVTSP